MSQRDQLQQLIIDFCNKRGSRTFSLQELHDTYKDYRIINIGGETPQATIRRLLQELRKNQFISFTNNSGHYTLRGTDLLNDEKKDIRSVDISNETPDKREYLIETYARNCRWVKQAKKTYGLYCMLDDCRNTFMTDKNQPYIEVHHIIPLYQGGEDGIWNLSVVCSHHHRMAHFAQKRVVLNIKKTLFSKVNAILA